MSTITQGHFQQCMVIFTFEWQIVSDQVFNAMMVKIFFCSKMSGKHILHAPNDKAIFLAHLFGWSPSHFYFEWQIILCESVVLGRIA